MNIIIKVELPVKYNDHLKRLEKRYGKETVRKILAEVLAKDIIDRYSGILGNEIQPDETLLELVESFAIEELEKKKFQGIEISGKAG